MQALYTYFSHICEVQRLTQLICECKGGGTYFHFFWGGGGGGKDKKGHCNVKKGTNGVHADNYHECVNEA